MPSIGRTDLALDGRRLSANVKTHALAGANIRREQAAQHADRRCLPADDGAEKALNLPLFDLDRKIIHHRTPRIALG